MRNGGNILIAANWKMNILPSESRTLAIACTDLEWSGQLEVLICPPYTHLQNMKSLQLDGIKLGAQNCSEHKKGAYTGEVSAAMLVDLQCEYVILGHSECRDNNPNENARICAKINAAVSSGLKVIYCCGEPQEFRNSGKEFDFIKRQLKADLFDLNKDALSSINIAYEPVWAIGSGNQANQQQIIAMHGFIQNEIKNHFSLAENQNMRILYGGSVNAGNVHSYANLPEVDGVLVGGASLIPKEFKAIINAFNRKLK